MVSPKRPARAAARSPRWCALPLPWRPGPLVSWVGCRRRLSPARQKFLLVVWRCCRRSDCCFLLLRCGPWPGCRESGQLLRAGQRRALSGGARDVGEMVCGSRPYSSKRCASMQLCAALIAHRSQGRPNGLRWPVCRRQGLRRRWEQPGRPGACDGAEFRVSGVLQRCVPVHVASGGQNVHCGGSKSV